jgi:hypothetical protein
MFNILTTLSNPTQPGSMFMEYYFIPDLTTDPSNPKMVLNLNQITNAGTGKVAQHPLYSVSSSDEAIQALQRFHSKTLARLAAGTCDAPRFNP